MINNTPVLPPPSSVFGKVFGVHQVVATQQQHQEYHPKKRRRRRRRRNNSDNNNNNNNHNSTTGDDSSTCATVSSESSSITTTTTGSHPQRLDLVHATTTTTTTSQSRRKSRTKTNKKDQEHQRSLPNNQYDDYDDDHVPLEEQANYVALDCEMVGVGEGGRWSSVARVTMVAWDGSIVLDEMVRPDQEVTDYRTFVSGITAQDLESANCCTLEEVRIKVQQVLHDGHNNNNSNNYKVLVGHALKNDLRALGISHPWHHTRDTAKYEPFMQVRFDDGVLWPKKLSELVKTRLHREIQPPGVPHSSYQDAMAAMDLYKLVRRKWEKVMSYKINKTNEIENMRTTATV
jgi:RNA exonuclease 4